MFELLLWLSAGLWVLFLAQTVANWVLVPRLRKLTPPPPARWPVVSIVVPARDEQRGIGEAVGSLCRQDYESFEVIVVNDRSSDRTPHILDRLQQQYENLTVIEGSDPPPGWLGKPNALEIGRVAAKGDWLLFVDADVVYESDVLRRAIAFALKQDVAMLVVPPLFIAGRAFEAVLMSSLYLTVFAAFPLYLVARSKSKWLAAGNGAGNLVRRDALQACGAFESLKDSVLDDVYLGHQVKQAGHAIAVAVGAPLVRVRMYHGARELIRGFSKNVYPMVGRRRPWLAVMPAVLGTVLSLVPYIGFVDAWAGGTVSIPATIALVLMHLVMGSLVVRFRQPWYVTFLNPLREIGWWWIMLRSAIVYYRRGIVWRGRCFDDSVPGEAGP